MFIFNSLSIVIFLVLALDQNRKLPHVMMAWVEFNSFFFFINPSWDKAGSHICKHSRVLKQMIKKGNISDTTRRDFFFYIYSHPAGERTITDNSQISLHAFAWGKLPCIRLKLLTPHFTCCHPFTSTTLAALHGNGWQAQIIQDESIFLRFTLNCK